MHKSWFSSPYEIFCILHSSLLNIDFQAGLSQTAQAVAFNVVERQNSKQQVSKVFLCCCYWFEAILIFFSKQFSMHPTSVLLASSPGFLTGYTKLQLTRIKVFFFCFKESWFLFACGQYNICTLSVHHWLATIGLFDFRIFVFDKRNIFALASKSFGFEFLSSDGKHLFYGCSTQFQHNTGLQTNYLISLISCRLLSQHNLTFDRYQMGFYSSKSLNNIKNIDNQ